MFQRIYRFVEKYPSQSFLALALLPAVLSSIFFSFGNIGGQHSPYYFVGYSTGFGGRKLLGTLIEPLLPAHVGHREMLPILYSVHLVVYVLLLSFLGRINSLPSSTRTAALAVVAVYLVSPFSFLFFIGTGISMLYIDIWLFLLTLLFLVLFFRLRHHRILFYLSAFIVSAVGILIHHLFCCICFPLFVSLFVYEIFSFPKLTIRRFLPAFCVCLSSLLMLLCILFFGSTTDLDTLYPSIVSRCTKGVILQERCLWEVMYNNVPDTYFHFRYFQLLPTILLLSPLLVLFHAPWLMSIRQAKGAARWKYWLMYLSSNLLFIPVFLVASDYGRWFIAYFFIQLLLLVAMLLLEDAPLTESLLRLFSYARRYYPLSLACIVYLVLLSVSGIYYGGFNLVDDITAALTNTPPQ